ncbi:hypothetical protein HID58_024898 [Brassica napus]|uniref:BnaAnng22060D protein n=3 Tax=Brassica TaxID=3705 RepID=A0A078JIL9_BRANA|nr:hypothetical protein HID58_024898 [Brassica napus]CAF2157489.1 unnamed protein product [Brassica napus]CAG7900797.1 unnamed protein product [Brassica rapa]CDY66295.1 BnaAnng22060D [Brassica napus]VDC95766.1 unnamed protein product [Brassica rapa]
MLTQSSYKRNRFDLTCSIFVVVPWKKGDDISQWRFLFQQPSTQERCIGGYGFNGVCGGYDDGGRAMDVVMKELMIITKEVMIATEEEVVVEETVEEHVAVVVTAVTVTSVTGVATVFTKQAVVVFQEETVIVDIEKFFVA